MSNAYESLASLANLGDDEASQPKREEKKKGGKGKGKGTDTGRRSKGKGKGKGKSPKKEEPAPASRSPVSHSSRSPAASQSRSPGHRSEEPLGFQMGKSYVMKHNLDKVKNDQRYKATPEFKIVFNSVSLSDALRFALIHSNVGFEEELIEGRRYEGIYVPGVIVIHKNGVITRSGSAALRFVGSLYHMYPKDPEEQAAVDEMIDHLRKFHKDFFLCKPSDTDRIVAETMMMYERKLEKLPGPGFFGRDYTIADFEMVAMTKWLILIKNVNSDMFSGAFPKIMSLYDTITKKSKSVNYTAERHQKKRIFDLKCMEMGLKEVTLKKAGDDW